MVNNKWESQTGCQDAEFLDESERSANLRIPSPDGVFMRSMFLGLLSLPLALYAQVPNQPSRSALEALPQILVLGTYHMANPGHDLGNIQADDVRSAKRQQEIAELMTVLKKFNPTKIAIEDDVTSNAAPSQYANYLASKYELSRNEIDQIGYRLAKELGHGKISPIDVGGDFPWLRVINYAKANGRGSKIDAMTQRTQADAQNEDAFLKSHSILQMMERVACCASASRWQ